MRKLSELFRRVVARESAAPAAKPAAPPPEVAQAQTEATGAPHDEPHDEPFRNDEPLPDGATVNRVGKRKIELKVSDAAAVRPALPAGYRYPDAEEAARLHAELLRELPPHHPLFGVPLATFAAREGSDDTLFRYRGNPRLFALVRPTKAGQAETDGSHPAIVFTGSFEQFVKREETFCDPELPA